MTLDDPDRANPPAILLHRILSRPEAALPRGSFLIRAGGMSARALLFFRGNRPFQIAVGEGESPAIEGGNNFEGESLTEVGIMIKADAVIDRIGESDFENHTAFGIKSERPPTLPRVLAHRNWWNTPNGPRHASNVFNQTGQDADPANDVGDAVSDGVDFGFIPGKPLEDQKWKKQELIEGE